VEYIGSFLLVLGLLQLVAVYFHLRGASLTGRLSGPGILFGILLFTSGVWLVIDTPLLQLLVSIIVSLPLAWWVLLVFGALNNLGWDPSKNFAESLKDAGASATEVDIPVRMTHIAQNANRVDYLMPGTLFTPSTWGSEDRISRGQVVLVVCGAGDTRLTFKWRLFEEFLRRNIAVLTVDPPGHGDFQTVPITIANGRAACRGALEWLLSQPEVGTVGACGISFGGNLLADLTAADQRIKCLATISTPTRLDPVTRRVFVMEVLGLLCLPRNIKLLREGSLCTLLHEYRRLKGAWFGEELIAMIEKLDTVSTMGGIGDRPTLIAHGTSDAAIPVSNARRLYEASSPEHTLLLIPQATHVSPVLFSHEMSQLADWMKQWLDYNRTDAQQAI
jgi:alpha-beta hydrolase superfamily lysophospholipase